jgi:ATP-dependent DNA helicase 2 subunit 1
MVDFLASFNLGAVEDAPSSAPVCDSVQDLGNRLHNVLSLKVTETRAEHVAIAIELPASVLFNLVLSQAENHALESRGTFSNHGAVLQPDGSLLRVINASDALMNQPQDDPVLQKSVAKHIVDALGSIDNSTWTVREMLRNSQGWNFVYLCKDSHKIWKSQTAKVQKSLVAEYSSRDPDPVLASMHHHLHPTKPTKNTC